MKEGNNKSIDLSSRHVREMQDAIVEASAAIAAKLGLNSTDALAIEFISLSSGSIGPSELGQRLAVSRSSATEVVDRLVRSGHVERVRDKKDRRRFMLLPTEMAIDRVSSLIFPLIDSLNSLSDTYTVSEKRVILSYMDGVISSYRNFSRNIS